MIINYYLADKNEPKTLKIAGSYKFISWEKNEDGSITHLTGVETNIDLLLIEGTIGKYYKITYTVSGINDFGVYCVLGASKSNVIRESGTHTIYLKLTDNNILSFFASGVVTLSDLSIEEYIVISDKLDFIDRDFFIDKSWTLSYSFTLGAWVSWHSYIPDIYLSTNNGLYSIMNDELSIDYALRDHNGNYITSNDGSIITYKI